MAEFRTGEIVISYEVAGQGPPLLLLHGFPQTRALWGPVAERLARRFTCVMADLRGYGGSSKPEPLPDLSNYSFRAMAEDQRGLMEHLGFPRFHLAGHDRGGRVAHRMALDRPDAVETLTVMDIVPTRYLLDHWSKDVSVSYFHWSFLAQPAPFPERMIGHDPDHFYEACLLGWGGTALADFPALGAYRAAWRDPSTIAGMTNDYRAAVSIDQAHDAGDQGAAVDCPALVLYGAHGAMAQHFDVPATWAASLARMQSAAIAGGHFFVDQNPGQTATALLGFLP